MAQDGVAFYEAYNEAGPRQEDNYSAEVIWGLQQYVQWDPYMAPPHMLLGDKDGYHDWMQSQGLAFAWLDLMYNYGNNVLERLISDLKHSPGWDFLGPRLG